MAKSKESESGVSIEDARKLVAKALRGMYGMGVPDSETRVSLYEDEAVMAMAEAEAEGRRDKIPAMLAQAKVRSQQG